MLKKVISAAILASTLSFVGCNTIPAADTQREQTLLQSKTWVLIQIGATEIKQSSNPATLQFDQAALRVSGSDGCNRLMGGYSVEGKKLQFSEIASTRMMCVDNMQTADQFNQALAKVTAYQAYRDSLRLLDRQGNVVLKFISTTR